MSAETDRAPRARLAWVRARTAQLRAWLSEPGHARWVAAAALMLLLAGGLLLPPLSLLERVATPGFHQVSPGSRDLAVPAEGAAPEGARLEIPRTAILRSTRIKLRGRSRLPGGMADLPPGAEQLGPVYTLDVRGPPPQVAYLRAPLGDMTDRESLVDPYGWDEAQDRWRWLAPGFPNERIARVALPLESFVPSVIVFTEAVAGEPEVAAVLDPPPAALPAVAAELPVLEVRAFGLDGDGGALRRRPVPPAPRRASIWGVVDNLEGQRVRDDLITNILARPERRRAHRAAIVEAVASDGLDGIVLDYRQVPDELQEALAEMATLLARDLRPAGLVVAVAAPRPTGDGWHGGAVRWRALGASGAAVRVRLPADEPLSVAALDGMVRWALGRVDRRRLHLSVPVFGVDVVDGNVSPIGFGTALARILDLARSDAPARISPGDQAAIDLPAIAASELGRDAATGMWRFYWWDANRRRHTIWLNDAEGLAPAFEIAQRYRLQRLALDGVSQGVDPFIWRMVRRYVNEGIVAPPTASYQLQWRLIDDEGRVVQETTQPLEEASFAFRAPPGRGEYELSVNLLTADGALAAPGHAAPVLVAPPPRPTTTPTALIFVLEPTPESYQTAPIPVDERITRTPVRMDEEGGQAAAADEYDATFDFARGVLRAGPSVRDEPLADLRPGDRLQVLERSEDEQWLRVRMLNTGREGWVAADLVRFRPPTVTPTPGSGGSSTATPAVDPGTEADPAAEGPRPPVRPTGTARPGRATATASDTPTVTGSATP